MTIALIDADIVAFRAAAVSNEDPHEGAALERVDWTMQMIMDNLQTNQYRAYLTGQDNFRKKLYPEYKANRKDKPLPKYLNECKEHLVMRWKAKISIESEADDLLGIDQCESEPETTVICSIDKDLLQIPGRHYNFVNQNMRNIAPDVGFYNFMLQMAIGDVSDNVKGLPGIGHKKAPRLLDVRNGPEEWQIILAEEYKKHPHLDFELNWKLLWIARTHEYLEEVQEEARQRSMLTPDSQISPLSEDGAADPVGIPKPGDETEE